MAKIVLSLDGKIVDQRFLGDARLLIGRDGACDLVVAAPEIGLQQAAVTTVVNDHIIEDLEGVGGMLVNGKPVRRHLLQNGDVVFLGAYRLKYLNTASAGRGLDRTLLLSAEQIDEIAELTGGGTFGVGLATTAAHDARSRFARGRITCVEGAHAGRDTEIERILYPLGVRGACYAVINRRPSGCYLTQVSGRARAQVNGQPVGSAAVLLADGDTVEVGDEKFAFHSR